MGVFPNGNTPIVFLTLGCKGLFFGNHAILLRLDSGRWKKLGRCKTTLSGAGQLISKVEKWYK